MYVSDFFYKRALYFYFYVLDNSKIVTTLIVHFQFFTHFFDIHYRQESGGICCILWLLCHKTAGNSFKNDDNDHSFDIHYRQESGIICFILWLLCHKTASNGSKLPVMIITGNFEPLLAVL